MNFEAQQALNFNSRAPRGARLVSNRAFLPTARFQLTRPARGATAQASTPSGFAAFQLTRPARGATGTFPKLRDAHPISTHAPRAGRDPRTHLLVSARSYFNSRAPRGARRGGQRRCGRSRRFQLTRPARGATSRHKHCADFKHISTHAPRAGRDSLSCRKIKNTPQHRG